MIFRMALTAITTLMIASCGGSSESDGESGGIINPPIQNQAPTFTIQTNFKVNAENVYEAFSVLNGNITLNVTDPEGDDILSDFKIISSQGVSVRQRTDSPHSFAVHFFQNTQSAEHEVEFEARDVKGNSTKRLIKFRSYSTPVKEFEFGYDQSKCVLSIDGLSCEGSGYPVVNLPVGLDFVSDITLGVWHGCAITRGQLQCWSHPNYRSIETQMPTSGVINNLKAYSVGTQCADIDGAQNCWGNGQMYPTSVVNDYRNNYEISYVSPNLMYRCGVNASTLTCELPAGKEFTASLPPAEYTHVVAYNRYACVADQSSLVTCFNLTYDVNSPNNNYLSSEIWANSGVTMQYGQIKALFMDENRLVVHADDKLTCALLAFDGVFRCSEDLGEIRFVKEAKLVQNILCYLVSPNRTCVTMIQEEAPLPVAIELAHYSYKVWAHGAKSGNVASRNPSGLLYSLSQAPNVGNMTLGEDGTFNYVANGDNAQTATAYYIGIDSGYQSKPGVINLEIIEKPVYGKQCDIFDCYDFLLPSTNTVTQNHMVIPAPEFYTIDTIKIVNFRPDMFVSNIEITTDDPSHSCTVEGLSVNEVIDIDVERTITIRSKRTSNVQAGCSVYIEFFSDPLLSLRRNYLITTN